MDRVNKFKIEGLCAATFTPYSDDGKVDYDAVDAHAKDLALHSVKSAFGTFRDSEWHPAAKIVWMSHDVSSYRHSAVLIPFAEPILFVYCYCVDSLLL